MGSRVRIRLFHILHFVMHFLFLLLKNSKSGVDDRGHRLRSGSPVTNLPGATPPSNYKNKTPLIATGIDPKFNTPIKIMSELRQYHPNLRVLQIKHTKMVGFS